MKSILFTSVLLLSSLVFAGPEDHIQNQICYNLKNPAVKIDQVPGQICLEQISLDLQAEKIYIYSYFQGSLYQNVQLDYLARKNEDFYSFRSSSVFHKEWNSGCGDGLLLTVKIQGKSDNYGEVEPQYLDISVEQELTNDTCHSKAQKTVYEYTLQ